MQALNSPIIKTMRWAGHVARIGGKKKAHRLLIGESEGKRPIGRPRRRSVDNTKIDRGVIRWVGMNWIGLTQDMDR
jgi:hypothetical protein